MQHSLRWWPRCSAQQAPLPQRLAPCGIPLHSACAAYSAYFMPHPQGPTCQCQLPCEPIRTQPNRCAGRQGVHSGAGAQDEQGLPARQVGHQVSAPVMCNKGKMNVGHQVRVRWRAFSVMTRRLLARAAPCSPRTWVHGTREAGQCPPGALGVLPMRAAAEPLVCSLWLFNSSACAQPAPPCRSGSARLPYLPYTSPRRPLLRPTAVTTMHTSGWGRHFG